MSLSALASSSQVQTQDAVSTLMLRKALDLQQASAEQLIASLPQPAATPDPNATLGRSVNTFA